MHPRIRRLAADYEKTQQAFAAHESIKLIETEGTPPERYVFEISIPGLSPEGERGQTPSTLHKAEIFLPQEYPRRAPFCRMLTPVFHPNIDPTKICIGDHWSAGQTLPFLVTQIAEMICFQSYNTKSPLNAIAAAWTETHVDELPLYAKEITVD
ncbi:hypothetical protein IEN85_23010 [Pelagicoccus sp. NFK12]|uniref:UBC core domain-containing protein n=1 Tax=Pelagicoccus enzymogenes TaxID=2773457 RepID=A0A927FFE4_9BACT|nr:ubiquitin-conjugating enzyme E2 [Pelagicoccus enzymogenes]MBD5782388.1 hypothetical protein [Pelagicoccus enzymogenes]MDQ8200980.1 ubiquitin-conjugating enzyme E2 [Pelagicoccus enzymogenes]